MDEKDTEAMKNLLGHETEMNTADYKVVSSGRIQNTFEFVY